MIPPNEPDAGPLPLAFAYFLSNGNRKLSIQQRAVRAARFVSTTVIGKSNETWINILHAFLIIYTLCKLVQDSRGNKARTKAINSNIEVLHLPDPHKTLRQEIQYRPSPSDLILESNVDAVLPSVHDLTTFIQAMTSPFLESTQPSGKESKIIQSCLTLILKQMGNTKIPLSHRFSVLHSLLIGPARQATDKLNTSTFSLDEVIVDIKKKDLFDTETQDRRITRWTNVTFGQFRALTDREKPATRNCIEFPTDYQKDTPYHFFAEEHLHSGLRSMCRTVHRCEKPFQRT